MYGFRLPEDFLIGTANSAFQSEGAWERDGKSESIMDYYARAYAGKPMRVIGAGTKKVVNCYSEELPTAAVSSMTITKPILRTCRKQARTHTG